MNPEQLPDPRASLWALMAVHMRFLRVRAGESGADLGRVLGYQRAQVSKLEHGKKRLRSEHCTKLDEHYATGGLFSCMYKLAMEGHDAHWFAEYLTYEMQAVMMRMFADMLVPGFLQTEDYATALLKEGQVKDFEAVLAARMSRHRVVTKPDPAECWIVMDEGVLDRPVGGVAVMRQQLAALLEVSKLPNVTIRVVPRRAGAHVGLDGNFQIISTETEEVAYTEAQRGGRLVRGPEVRDFAVLYERVGAKALPEDASRGLIETIMRSMT